MKRKSLALLMAAVMMLGAAGCGSGKTEEPQTEAPASAPAADAGTEADAAEPAASAR